ncbi:MAG: portal protein [Alphaproteobacteria bacterium]
MVHHSYPHDQKKNKKGSITEGGLDQSLCETLFNEYQSAQAKRNQWQGHWRQCYDYALPQRAQSADFGQTGNAGARKHDHLFDGTAPDAVEQLASSLMAALTPAWLPWFELVPGHDLSEAEAASIAPELTNANKMLHHHIAHSNLQVELHQSYLDLVTIGTANLLFEETPIGSNSAFKFLAVPMDELALASSDHAALDTSFRLHPQSRHRIEQSYGIALPDDDDGDKTADQAAHYLLEIVRPTTSPYGLQAGYDHFVLYAGKGGLPDAGLDLGSMQLLKQSHFKHAPYLHFRWMKVPGENYGRSPVMKALPDIKTANKVVELILKNATIAVTGVWQAEDDGVLNPATVKLVPGAIIPKAAGSAGLTPLQSPGQFDVSQLVLDDVRARIRHAMLIDRLGPIQGQAMTATEILERAGEMDHLLGGSYGRLQSELLYPLARRAVYLLQKRGEIADFPIDGKHISLEITSPLAQNHKRKQAAHMLEYLQQISLMGEDPAQLINVPKTARWLAEAMQIPQDLLINI